MIITFSGSNFSKIFKFYFPFKILRRSNPSSIILKLSKLIRLLFIHTFLKFAKNPISPILILKSYKILFVRSIFNATRQNSNDFPWGMAEKSKRQRSLDFCSIPGRNWRLSSSTGRTFETLSFHREIVRTARHFTFERVPFLVSGV